MMYNKLWFIVRDLGLSLGKLLEICFNKVGSEPDKVHIIQNSKFHYSSFSKHFMIQLQRVGSMSSDLWFRKVQLSKLGALYLPFSLARSVDSPVET